MNRNFAPAAIAADVDAEQVSLQWANGCAFVLPNVADHAATLRDLEAFDPDNR